MPHVGRFVLALALGAGLLTWAVVAVISYADQDELAVGELLRVETFPTGDLSPVDDQIRFQAELLSGQRSYTDADVATRLAPSMQEFFTAEELNRQTALLTADGGVSFVRVTQREPEFVTVLGIDDTGEVGELLIAFDDQNRIAGLDVIDTGNPRRLPTWESALILLGAAALLAAAAVAWRYRAAVEAWLLAATAFPTLAGVLVLSDAAGWYTLGRVVPSATVVLGVAILLRSADARWRSPIVALAAGAAVIGVGAPFSRDATLIGHPEVAGALTDSEPLYRTLLAGSAALAGFAMIGVVVGALQNMRRTSAPMRPALWAAAVVAAVWAAGALAIAADTAVGEGRLAAGPMNAITRAALLALPVLVVFRLLSSSWSRPELATLVIDLEAGGAELQPAIAKALDDPALQVLMSPDGEVLVDEAGHEVSVGVLGPDRSLTRIQSGSRLVGGIVHATALQRDPARLESVAAAAGMAMEVSRLNQKVLAQLDEVDASRSRILEASDAARRRVERDLHDGAQQRLVALGLALGRARRLAAAENHADLAGLIDDATTEVRGTIEDIRMVARGGQPALLAERGLATAVDALAERAPIPVEIDIRDTDLASTTATTAYYVIAEGLTNVAKHAKANTAQVSLTCENGEARIAIRDDGSGGAEIAPGSGLEGLNDRVAAAGGEFTIASGPSGTRLEATLPCA